MSASIANDGSHILLVSQRRKCLLQSGKIFPPSKLCEVEHVKDSLTCSDTNALYAGGMILGTANSNGACTFVLWDMSGEIQLISVKDDSWESATGSLAPYGLQSNASTEIGYIRFVGQDNFPICGVWSTRSEEWTMGCEGGCALSSINSGISIFRLNKNELGYLSAKAMPSIWHSEVSTGKGVGVFDSQVSTDELVPSSTEISLGSSMTCCAVVGGSVSCPYTLVQGYSSGKISFVSLAAYAIPGAPEKTDAECFQSIKHSQIGHRGSVVCFVEIVRNVPAEPYSYNSGPQDSRSTNKTSAKGILVSGGQDGSLLFWSLEKGQVGKVIFSVHPHTGEFFLFCMLLKLENYEQKQHVPFSGYQVVCSKYIYLHSDQGHPGVIASLALGMMAQ